MLSDISAQLSTEDLSLSKEDVRGSRPALPQDVAHYVNDVQRVSLKSLENFGWRLEFIRRSLFVPPMVVVKHNSITKFAIVEEDGSVNLSPFVKLRH